MWNQLIFCWNLASSGRLRALSERRGLLFSMTHGSQPGEEFECRHDNRVWVWGIIRRNRLIKKGRGSCQEQSKQCEEKSCPHRRSQAEVCSCPLSGTSAYKTVAAVWQHCVWMVKASGNHENNPNFRSIFSADLSGDHPTDGLLECVSTCALWRWPVPPASMFSFHWGQAHPVTKYKTNWHFSPNFFASVFA